MDIISNVLYLATFCIFPIFTGFLIIQTNKSCNVLINGIYTGYSTYIFKNTIQYYPIFEYNYNGQKYCNKASLSIYNLEKYVKNNTYQIYINAENPNEYILEKGKPIGAYVCISIGVVFVFLFFLVKIGVLT